VIVADAWPQSVSLLLWVTYPLPAMRETKLAGQSQNPFITFMRDRRAVIFRLHPLCECFYLHECPKGGWGMEPDCDEQVPWELTRESKRGQQVDPGTLKSLDHPTNVQTIVVIKTLSSENCPRVKFARQLL